MILSKEKIKAIRIVNGFNADLRRDLTGINRNQLFEWMEENRSGIFGINSELSIKPSWNDDNWERWERLMNIAVTEVITGGR